MPPHGPVNVAFTLLECQWPVTNGRIMSPISAIVSRPAVTYVNPLNGRMPKMLNAHTAMITPIAMKFDRLRWTMPSYTVNVVCGNQRAWIRSPMMLPKIDSTTDHPIQ